MNGKRLELIVGFFLVFLEQDLRDGLDGDAEGPADVQRRALFVGILEVHSAASDDLAHQIDGAARDDVFTQVRVNHFEARRIDQMLLLLLWLLGMLLRMLLMDLGDAVAAESDVVKIGEEAVGIDVVEAELKFEFLADGEMNGTIQRHHQRASVFGNGGRLLIDVAGDGAAVRLDHLRRFLVGAEKFHGAADFRVQRGAVFVADYHVETQDRVARVDIPDRLEVMLARFLLRQTTARQPFSPLDQLLL